MVLSALECGSDALLEHLFTECGLLAWLTGSPRTVEPAPRDGDPRPPGRGGPYRAGCARLDLLRLNLKAEAGHEKILENTQSGEVITSEGMLHDTIICYSGEMAGKLFLGKFRNNSCS